MRSFLNALSEALDGFRNLDSRTTRLVFAGVAAVVVLLIVAWRFMVPFLLLAVAVTLFLRYSRPKDSL